VTLADVCEQRVLGRAGALHCQAQEHAVAVPAPGVAAQ